MKRILLLLVVVVAGVGLWAFEPWRAFTSSEVDEKVPGLSTVTPSSAAPSGSPSAIPVAEPVELSRGSFQDAEHGTDGTARIIELTDGRRFLRLEGLATSDGPDLHVWLSDRKPGGSWFKYDDGRHLKLGRLKATHGNQNYPIPASADLSGFRSAVIWCDRFNVAFGAAPVSLAG